MQGFLFIRHLFMQGSHTLAASDGFNTFTKMEVKLVCWTLFSRKKKEKKKADMSTASGGAGFLASFDNDDWWCSIPKGERVQARKEGDIIIITLSFYFGFVTFRREKEGNSLLVRRLKTRKKRAFIPPVGQQLGKLLWLTITLLRWIQHDRYMEMRMDRKG